MYWAAKTVTKIVPIKVQIKDVGSPACEHHALQAFDGITIHLIGCSDHTHTKAVEVVKITSDGKQAVTGSLLLMPSKLFHSTSMLSTKQTSQTILTMGCTKAARQVPYPAGAQACKLLQQVSWRP